MSNDPLLQWNSSETHSRNLEKGSLNHPCRCILNGAPKSYPDRDRHPIEILAREREKSCFPADIAAPLVACHSPWWPQSSARPRPQQVPQKREREMEATTRSSRYKGHLYKGQLIKMLISSCETLTLRSLSSIRRSPLKNIWRVAEQSSLPLAERLLPCRGLRGRSLSYHFPPRVADKQHTPVLCHLQYRHTHLQ